MFAAADVVLTTTDFTPYSEGTSIRKGYVSLTPEKNELISTNNNANTTEASTTSLSELARNCWEQIEQQLYVRYNHIFFCSRYSVIYILLT